MRGMTLRVRCASRIALFTGLVACLATTRVAAATPAHAPAAPHAASPAPHAAVAATSRAVLPWIADDYPRAVTLAKARKLPIFVESWAPW